MVEEKKDLLTSEGDYGRIDVSKDVIAIIAGLATVDVEGVVGITYQVKSGTYSLVQKDNFSKGIDIKVSDDGVTVSINLMTDYEKGIYSVAKEVQKRVKEMIEKMTGKKVNRVDINVKGVKIKEKREEQNEG